MTDSVTTWIQSFPSGQIWFNKLKSKATIKNYLPSFKKYCDFVHKNPDELINLKIEGLQNISTVKEFLAENTLETFLKNSEYPLSVKAVIRTTVLSFYKANRRNLVNVSEVDTPETKKRQPTINDIVELENSFDYDRDKALLWFVASSPVRLGTLVKLRWNDLKETHDSEVPYYFEIESARLKGEGRGKFKGLKHVGFLHSLAVKKLEAYKQELQRNEYILNEKSPIFIAYRKQTKLNKETKIREKCKDNIHALTKASIEHHFDTASLVAWHDLDKKRYSIHDLREFFQTAVENKMNVNMIKPLMSHKVKGTDGSYSSHNISELLEKYKLALPYLLPQTVEAVKAELNETEKTVQELSKQNAEKDKQLSDALTQMLELKKLTEAVLAQTKKNEELAKKNQQEHKEEIQNIVDTVYPKEDQQP